MIIYDEHTRKKYNLSMDEYVDGEWIDADETIIDSSFRWDNDRDCWSTDGDDITDYLEDWKHYATDFDDMFPWEREKAKKLRPRRYSLTIIE